jgi:hypothetical protein
MSCTSLNWVKEKPYMLISLGSLAGAGSGIETGQSAPHTGLGTGIMTS